MMLKRFSEIPKCKKICTRYHLDWKIFLLEIKATTQYSLTFIFTMEITSCPTKSLAIERKPLSQEF